MPALPRYLARHGDAWKYQRFIPVPLRPLLGKRTNIVRYIPSMSVREAGKLSAAYGLQDDATFAKLRNLSGSEAADLTQQGGIGSVVSNIPLLRSILQNEEDHLAMVAKWDARGFAKATGRTPEAMALTLLDLAKPSPGTEITRAQLARSEALVAKVTPPASAFSFDGLLQLWIRSFGPDWRGRTDDHQRALDRLREALGGECDYRQITQAEIGKLRDYNQARGDTPSTQRKRLESLSSMFSVAVSEQHIAANPCAGVKVRYKGEKVFKRRNGDDRPFSGAQMRTILETAERERFGGKRHEAVMWVLRLLVWTGARPQEIVQLQRGDVGTDNGVPVIRIREACAVTGKRHDHKTVKNAESIRIVPLHAEVADFVKYARGPAGEFVFSCFRWNRTKGRRGWFDNHFGPFMRKTCGITDTVLSLYSMRHAFHTAMRTARIDRDAQRYLVGHGSPDIHGQYGRGPGLKRLAADVAKIDPLSVGAGAKIPQ